MNAGAGGACHRRPPRPLPYRTAHHRLPGLPRPESGRPVAAASDADAHALLLSRLPAQPVDQGARGQLCAGRRRLPSDGGHDGPQHRHHLADGRRRRQPGSAFPRRTAAPSTSSPTWATAPTPLGHPRDPRRRRGEVNITYKLLYNDAVAMTGGQPVEQQLSPCRMVTRQLAAEGVRASSWCPTSRRSTRTSRIRAGRRASTHRDELDACSASCARRRASPRSSTTRPAPPRSAAGASAAFPDPPQRVFINERSAKAAATAAVQSNCISVLPLETEFGRKRAIDQSSCNKDYSCAKGFCPSVRHRRGGGARQRRRRATVAQLIRRPARTADRAAR
jgi:hypothetical protein